MRPARRMMFPLNSWDIMRLSHRNAVSGLSERTERAGISSIKRISCIKENEFKSCRINNSQGLSEHVAMFRSP